MAANDLVRASRDGDQFHYVWAARQCLELLPGRSDLAAVTIEGASTDEGQLGAEAGEELIDVGLYYASEKRRDARLIRYVQLKHSTHRATEPWSARDISRTISGFAKRYGSLVSELGEAEVARRFRFEFTSNRPIHVDLIESIADLASASAPRHPRQMKSLTESANLPDAQLVNFFKLVSVEGCQPNLWDQRNLLVEDLSGYLPDADFDAPVQLKELVTRKATSEFKSNPSIHLYDVLRALKTSKELLQPAPCEIPDPTGTIAREQEAEILAKVLATDDPVVIHADGGVGKSVLAARLVRSMPEGSEAVLYDCYGEGLYRNVLNFRHRPQEALVQIANELAARRLCHPLIPSAHADARLYMRAFVHRLRQAIGGLRARTPEAVLCLVIDAADNAEMAAEEQRESASFVRHLIRAPMPDGVKLVFTCRSHRQDRLNAPQKSISILLEPFSFAESAKHLRTFYPQASDKEVEEFSVLSSSNPRVQALALSRNEPFDEMLKGLGPEPTTVERAIQGLLDSAIASLRDRAGAVEADQIGEMCRGLAVLRPLIPISVLSVLANVPEGAVRSFAFDLGRPLLVKGDSLHFMDEPAETWFRDRFRPSPKAMGEYLDRLRPLAESSSYIAAMLPQLLLEAGRFGELVEIALSSEALPANNPLARRDVELQRLTFALKASLHTKRYADASQLAMKAAGETAGEERQNELIQDNTDLAAALIEPDRLEEIVSRRPFGGGWMGAHHAYDAGLLSGREDLAAEASSRLRMATDWLFSWARLPRDERQGGSVSSRDRAEIARATLRLRGARDANQFLRAWRNRRLSFSAGQILADSLVDLGRIRDLDDLAGAATNNTWLLLSICAAARSIGHKPPTGPLRTLLRRLADHRVLLSEGDSWDRSHEVLFAVTSAVELAVVCLPPDFGTWSAILQRYLPKTPPEELCDRYNFGRDAPLLRAYALDAALRDKSLVLLDLAPASIRPNLEKGGSRASAESEQFLQEIGALWPWYSLSADRLCGRLKVDLGDAIQSTLTVSAQAHRHRYSEAPRVDQTTATQWLNILADAEVGEGPLVESLRKWIEGLKSPLFSNTLIALTRRASRSTGLAEFAMDVSAEAYNALESIREDAETRSRDYVRLARAVYALSPAEARVSFERAVEIASRVGNENINRWEAFLSLAEAAASGVEPRGRLAYRVSRAAELTYEFVARDKHFPWTRTVEALVGLSAPSSLAILSRWRDRRFGQWKRLLPVAIDRLVKHGHLPLVAPVALAGLDVEWDRLSALRRYLESGADAAQRKVGAQIAYRYMRVRPYDLKTWEELQALSAQYDFTLPDLDRLATAAARSPKNESEDSPQFAATPSDTLAPNWDELFADVELTNASAVRSLYDALDAYGPRYENEREYFREACRRIGPGRESNLIEALLEWPDFGVFDLHTLLDVAPVTWRTRPATRKALHDAILHVCRRQPDHVHLRQWYQPLPFDALVEQGIVTYAEISGAAISGYEDFVESLSTSDLFHLTTCTSFQLSPADAESSLDFGLDLIEDLLKPEDGDGPWKPSLQPSGDAHGALAGYLWSGLASPVASERWEHAHAIRGITECGWAALLSEVAKIEIKNLAPYSDASLLFYTWHARQWLVIGLARGGLDNPAGLMPAVQLLMNFVAARHVVIRRFAACALKHLSAAGFIAPQPEWDAVNQPALPLQMRTEPSYYATDDTGEPEDDKSTAESSRLYLELDIGPYWLAPLGRVWGLSQEAIARRVRKVVRETLGWSAGGWRDDARYARKIFDDGEAMHSHSDMPRTDDLTVYHVYHAMMVVAADLLAEKAVFQDPDSERDRFEDWLDGQLLTRCDGRWLFDRRDPRIVRQFPRAYGQKDWRWEVTAGYLDEQMLWEERIILWGNWEQGDENRETISIRSAFVSRAGAESLVAALQTAKEPDRYALPSASSPFPERQRETVKIVGWINNESMSHALDDFDPWGKGLRYPAPEPNKKVLDAIVVKADDDEGRCFRIGDTGTLRCETWANTEGYGRQEETFAGERLSADLGALAELAAAKPNDCLVVSIEVSRKEPRYGGDKADFERYAWPYIRYYLMDADGQALSL